MKIPLLRPARSDSAALRHIGSILAPHRKPLAWLACAVLASAGMELVPPLLVQQVIDRHLSPGIPEGLWLLAGLYILSSAAGQACAFTASWLTAKTSQQAIHSLRVRLFRHFQLLPLSYFSRRPLGDSISRCTADVDTLEVLFNSGFARVITDLVRMVTLAVAMLALSPQLSVLLVFLIPGMMFITGYFRRRIRSAENLNRAAVGHLNSHLHETLAGVETIRAFNRETDFAKRYQGLQRKTLQAYNLSARYSAVFSPIMQSVMGAVIAFILWNATGSLLPSLNISIGTLTAFLLLLKRFFEPIISLGEDFQTIQGALAGAERIFQVLDEPEEEPVEVKRPATRGAKAGIDLAGVTFGYTRSRPVLEAVSFCVEPGEHVVIVGHTGSGKSSIFHLASGLYRPWLGQVQINGWDPHGLDEAARRQLLGVVPQTVQLFSGTIRDNLVLGDRDIKEEMLESALCISGAEEFVSLLPAGLDTPLDQGNGCGPLLSAGQRQILSLARALVLNPPVLLLDEVTAGIDRASEERFYRALESKNLHGQHAILTIAHRLAAAQTADRVIVLEHGKIVEMGPPAVLAGAGGRFTSLLELDSCEANTVFYPGDARRVPAGLR